MIKYRKTKGVYLMKIGVSSYSFSKYLSSTKCGYLKICDIAKEIGFDGIEFVNLNNKSWGIEGDEIAMAKEIKKYCEGIGLEIAAYTVGANLLADDIDAEVAKLKHCVDVCQALGAPVMRHDVVYKLRDIPLYSYEDAIREIAPVIREVTEYAAERGIRTCTENHGFIFQSPDRVEELILAVDHKNYGWLCDMGNFLCADADPAESVFIAAPYTFHAHAKDFLFKPADIEKPEGYQITTVMGNHIRGTVVGHGVVPVRQCVNILKRAGYDGYLSLEFEGPEDNIAAIEAGYKNLRKYVNS